MMVELRASEMNARSSEKRAQGVLFRSRICAPTKFGVQSTMIRVAATVPLTSVPVGFPFTS